MKITNIGFFALIFMIFIMNIATLFAFTFGHCIAYLYVSFEKGYFVFSFNQNDIKDILKHSIPAGIIVGVAGWIICKKEEIDNIGTVVSAAENAVENNYLAQQIINEHKQELKDTTLLFDGDEEKAQAYIDAKNKAQGIGASDGVVETIEGTTNVILHPVDTAVGLYEVVTNPDKVYEAIKVSVTEWAELYDYALKNDPSLAGEMAGYLEGKIGGGLATDTVTGYAIGGAAAKVIQEVAILKNTLNLANRDKLLSVVQNQKLRNTVDQMYRVGSHIGDGGLADAIRYELKTGELVGNKSLLTKGAELITNLENIIKKQDLSPKDLKLAQDLLSDLKNAMNGK